MMFMLYTFGSIHRVCCTLALVLSTFMLCTAQTSTIAELYAKKDWKVLHKQLLVLKKKEPANAQYYLFDALAYLEENNIIKANEQAELALTLDSSHTRSWLVAAEAKFKMSQKQAGFELLNKAKKRFPDSASVYHAIGYALIRDNKYQEAIDPFENVLFRKPNNWPVLQQLATCYAKTNQYQSAADLFERYLDVYPNDVTSLLGMSECLLALNKPKEAVITIKKALAITPKQYNVYEALAYALQQSGAQREAVDTMTVLTTIQPNNPFVWFNLGTLHSQALECNSAIPAFKKALEISPRMSEAAMNLADCYVHEGFTDEAVTLYKRVSVSSPALAAGSYHAIGMIFREDNKMDESLKAHQQAVRLDSNSTIFLSDYIQTLVYARKYPEALELAQKTLPRFPEDVNVLYAYGLANIYGGKPEEVERIIQRIEVALPERAKELKDIIKR